jgi:TRAP-type mannitol/chloroaromatic compound transport system substrate-binding protein
LFQRKCATAAGEVVPAFEVLDAVGGGVAEIGHTAAFFWQGKMPAANFFTTVPFGLTAAASNRDPGSAAHHCVLRCARGTRSAQSR